MKNITFSAHEELIERARATARSRGTTLNEEVRKWLSVYSSSGAPANRSEFPLKRGDDPVAARRQEADGSQAARNARVERFRALMESLKHVDLGGPYTRDELNER